ncbi:MAG: phosphatidate cytidylyltransferase [Ginsengibacter sp.]
MKRSNLLPLLVAAFMLSVSLSSCEAIAGIFKAGVWFGIIGVVVIVVLIFWLIGKARK